MVDKQEPKPQRLKLDDVPFIQMLYSLEHSTNELEKAWSEGLLKEDVEKAHADLLDLWRSFVQNFPAWVEDHGAKLKELGFSTIIKKYPLDDEGFKSLEQAVTPVDRYNQFSIAALYQMQNILHALTMFKDPSHKETSFPSGKTESWWEAGAFSLIRSSIRSLAFTLEQQKTVYEELANEPHDSVVRPSWMHYMDTLRVILNNDLYEAAPPIILRTIRSFIAERSDIPLDKLPPNLATKLTGIEAYSTLGHLYGKLERACDGIGFDESIDRSYLVPLVIGSVIQLEKFAHQPLDPKLLKELSVEEP